MARGRKKRKATQPTQPALPGIWLEHPLTMDEVKQQPWWGPGACVWFNLSRQPDYWTYEEITTTGYPEGLDTDATDGEPRWWVTRYVPDISNWDDEA